MNSLAHSILKLSMRWTPSLIHPNESTSGELICSHSACGPPITNSSLTTQTKHIPKSYGLSPSSPNITKHTYTSHNSGNIKWTSSNSTYKHEITAFSLNPWVFAQTSSTFSLKLNYLAWASMKHWLHHVISLRRALLAWARPLFAQTHTTPRLDEDSCSTHTSFNATSLKRVILAWAR